MLEGSWLYKLWCQIDRKRSGRSHLFQTHSFLPRADGKMQKLTTHCVNFDRNSRQVLVYDLGPATTLVRHCGDEREKRAGDEIDIHSAFRLNFTLNVALNARHEHMRRVVIIQAVCCVTAASTVEKRRTELGCRCSFAQVSKQMNKSVVAR